MTTIIIQIKTWELRRIFVLFSSCLLPSSPLFPRIEYDTTNEGGKTVRTGNEVSLDHGKVDTVPVSGSTTT
jgi:hypothetical protein